MDLKDLLKSFREKQKLTQQELANKSGLSRNSISNYERGDRIPKVDDLKKIADALDIQLTDLMENKTSNSTVGENIKVARKEKGLTQKELADMVMVSSAYIQQLEKGIKDNPSLEVILKLQRALEIPLANLMNDDLSNSIFGENIKIARREKGLTQKQLATKLNVSDRTIQNYEGNQREPNIETLKKISMCLDIDLNNLLGINVQDKKIKIKTLEDYTTEELLKELLRREKTNE